MRPAKMLSLNGRLLEMVAYERSEYEVSKFESLVSL